MINTFCKCSLMVIRILGYHRRQSEFFSHSCAHLGIQIKPFPWTAMKLMFSVSANSEAQIKSPSFSLSSSSVTMMIFPCLRSSNAFFNRAELHMFFPPKILLLLTFPRLWHWSFLHVRAASVFLHIFRSYRFPDSPDLPGFLYPSTVSFKVWGMTET